MEALAIVSLAGFGLIFGSFANALVWRLHSQEDLREKLGKLEQAKPSKKRDKDIAGTKEELRALSMSRGRSMCSKCRHPLAPVDLVPFFSWLLLRGKCRYCRPPIEDPPLMELGLALAYVLSYIVWPLPWQGYGIMAFGFWLIFLAAFAALTLFDIRWFILPDKIVWPLVALALVQVLLHAFVFDGGRDVLAVAFWGVVIDSGLFYLLYKVSRGEWIGGGDVKLGIVLGLLVGGPLPALLLIFIASLGGTLASLPMMLRKQMGRGSVIPFGPFLMLAAVVLVLSGHGLADWLANLMYLE